MTLTQPNPRTRTLAIEYEHGHELTPVGECVKECRIIMQTQSVSEPQHIWAFSVHDTRLYTLHSRDENITDVSALRLQS